MIYVIIGGVAGGATAAARIRRNDEKAEIILYEKGEYISYANCGLPYYIGGVISNRRNLFLQTPESFSHRFNIDVRTSNEVVNIQLKDKSVEVVNVITKERHIQKYDKLLISTGSEPVIPDIKGVDIEGVFKLKDIYDTDNIKSYVDSNDIKTTVIVGCGFIGMEMAENLYLRGIKVSLVDMSNQIMRTIDYSVINEVHGYLSHKGIDIYLERELKEICRTDEGIELLLGDSEKLCADMVIMSVGVKPNSSLAIKSGIAVGKNKGIVVDKYLKTSDEYVYAVGDVIEYPHPLIPDYNWTNYLAGPANRQGRIVADNMCGTRQVAYEGSIGTSIAKIFDISVASTGLNTEQLKRNCIEYKSVTLFANSHAGYYPNASSITLKILFCPNQHKVLGAQAVGKEGVDKTIDSISQIIKHNGTIYDLIETEHCYAPPFSSAKSPVAMAGYIADNIVTGKMRPIYWTDILLMNKEDIFLVDVRTRNEHMMMGRIDNSVNIPLDEIRNRLNDFPKDKKIYIYCAVGLRGYLASNILRQNGFEEVYNLVGGYRLYRNATTNFNKTK